MADLMPRSATYKVKVGDCLWNIAKEQYGIPTFWEEIAKSNALRSPYRIFAGMTLNLPVIRNAVAPTASGTASTPPVKTVMVSPPGTFAQPAPDASKVAMRVAFPVFKYELDKMQRTEPNSKDIGDWIVIYSLQPKGELTLKRKGTLDLVELSNKSMEMKYQTESDNAVYRLLHVGDLSCSPGKSLELSFKLSVSSKFKRQVFSTSTCSLVPPSTWRYTYEPRAVEGEFEVYEIGGTFGFEADVTFQPKHPKSGVSVPEPSLAFTFPLALIAQFAIVSGICRRVAAGASRTNPDAIMALGMAPMVAAAAYKLTGPVGMALSMASMVVEYDEALHMIGRDEPGKVY